LRFLFSGDEEDLARTIAEKRPVLEALRRNPPKKRRKLTNRFSPTASRYLSSIEPDSPAEKLIIRAVSCKTAEEFIKSKEFTELFNYYLKKTKNKIKALRKLSDEELMSHYGASRFAEKFKTRDFQDVKKEIFEEIVVAVANMFFSDSTIKIMALQFKEGVDAETKRDALLGAEARLRSFISQFIKVFTTEEGEGKINFRPTFQAAYETIGGVVGARQLPQWARTFISRAEFAGETVATDPAPEMITEGQKRVAGFSRGIYRRDGDGENAPTQEFFRQRFKDFAEKMNPKDYICKMVQVGPVRQLLVLHKSYSHYLVEELRLLPQFEASLDDLKNLKPDAISFLGIPTKVIGNDYRIGYYLDGEEGESAMPVSWVNAEDITDYMGYLKKPLLTAANERVKAIGAMPVHGSAFTVEFKNGLRKTIVLAGDSGTGKSETIIAMVEQIINGVGEAKGVKSIELLSGDMLSLYEGDDDQIYMMGTEAGDFMRLTDISDDWQTRFRDILSNASKTNLAHATNPRATISGLCDDKKFLRPIRVNMFFTINNFDKKEKLSFEEELNPENLLLDTYPRGYRREKGTSGDQPNIFASVCYGNSARREAVMEKYGEEMDTLLGWEKSTLAFNDIPGKVFKARQMVRDLFEGEQVKVAGKPHRITRTSYKARDNKFQVQLQDEEGKVSEKWLDRSIFDQVYSPLASTYCGNPFIDPRGMDQILHRFAGIMKRAGVITGSLYTQLAVEGEQFSGPARASQAVINFINGDPRINERFQKNKRHVSARLTEKYGKMVFGQASLPEPLEAHNLWLLERQESDVVRLIDKDGKTISLKTPHYENGKREDQFTFNPSLMTPEIGERIKEICESQDHKVYSLEHFEQDISKYSHIKAWDNEYELIYQILIANGILRLGDPAESIDLWPRQVKIAQKIAKQIN
jgi:hypothetical protein